MSVRVRKILIIALSAVCCGGVIAGSVIWAYAPPGYTRADLSRYNNNGITGEASMSVTSFNVRCIAPESDRANNWRNRRDRVVDHIKRLDADIIGLQEATERHLNYILKRVDGYTAVGENRDYMCMRSERSCILFRSDKYELLDTRTFWLSDTPERPSKAEGAGNMRVCTYAILRDRATGITFAAINTHLDYKTGEIRMRQVEVLLGEFAELGIPAFITGDFNCEPDSPEYALLTEKLKDSRKVAASSEDFSFTYHNYGGVAGDPEAEFLDYIFLTDGVEADSYRVDTETVGGRVYSDHFSVSAKLRVVV